MASDFSVALSKMTEDLDLQKVYIAENFDEIFFIRIDSSSVLNFFVELSFSIMYSKDIIILSGAALLLNHT